MRFDREPHLQRDFRERQLPRCDIAFGDIGTNLLEWIGEVLPVSFRRRWSVRLCIPPLTSAI